MRAPFFIARFVVSLAIASTMLVGVPSATAAPVEYTVELAPKALPGSEKLAFDGDHITRFAATVEATTCGGEPVMHSGSVFKIDWSGAVPFSSGEFSISGRASTYYGPDYGADFTLAGQINQSHTRVTATLTLTNGTNAGGLIDCVGSFPVIAVPASFGTTDWGYSLKRTYFGKDISFNYKSGAITSFALVVHTTCGRGNHDAKVEGARIGLPSIQTTASGKFEIHSLIVDAYDSILQLDFVGRITKTKASGTFTISEPPGGFKGGGTDACASRTSWTAKPRSSIARPGPTAFFNWMSIKATTPTSTRYFFYVTELKCSGRANAVRITIAGRVSTIRCSRKRGWASRAVAPSKEYRAKVQAVRIKHGRIVKRGKSRVDWVSMPGPNDDWTDALPDVGTPPG